MRVDLLRLRLPPWPGGDATSVALRCGYRQPDGRWRDGAHHDGDRSRGGDSGSRAGGERGQLGGQFDERAERAEPSAALADARVDERSDDIGVELGSGLVDQLLARRGGEHGSLVGTGRGHRVVGVGHGHDPACDRDVGTGEPGGRNAIAHDYTRVLLKRGVAVNELTKFRYDAILFVGDVSLPPTAPVSATSELHWSTLASSDGSGGGSFAALERALRTFAEEASASASAPRYTVVRAVPNVELLADNVLVELLRSKVSASRLPLHFIRILLTI